MVNGHSMHMHDGLRQDPKYRLDGRTRSMLLLLEDRRDDSE